MTVIILSPPVRDCRNVYGGWCTHSLFVLYCESCWDLGDVHYTIITVVLGLDDSRTEVVVM
jgi:hypothetical protein